MDRARRTYLVRQYGMEPEACSVCGGVDFPGGYALTSRGWECLECSLRWMLDRSQRWVTGAPGVHPEPLRDA
jgi:hypothetical protein